MANNKITIKGRQIQALTEKMARLNENFAVYERAGLRKCSEAKDLLKSYNECVFERNKLMKEDEYDRRRVTERLLLCIAAADFACEAADILTGELKRTYGEITYAEHGFVELLSGLAKDLGGLVTIIDKVRDDRFSFNFADMSDEIMDKMTAKCLKEAEAIVERHDQAGNGNNIRFKENAAYRELKKQSHG